MQTYCERKKNYWTVPLRYIFSAFKSLVMYCLADLGKAKSFSTNTFVIN